MGPRVFLARGVYLLHVVVFVYGLLGWLLAGWVWLHLAFLLGLLVHWYTAEICILTAWERALLGPQAGEDRHFTRDLFRRFGCRGLSVQGAWRVLLVSVWGLIVLDLVLLLRQWL